MLGIVLLVVMAVCLGAVLLRAFKPRVVVVLQYQRGVLFNKGVLEKVLGPGRYWIPITKSVSSVDTRLQTLTLPGQEILTSDGLSLKVSLAGEYRIDEAERFLLTSVNPTGSLYTYAQQALRDAVGGLTFESLLATRTAISNQMLGLLAPQASSLGLELVKIEVRDVMLPGDLKRAYAQTIAAQQEGLANLERARAETASLRSLANAARLTQDHPGLLQLRAVQAIESSKGNTITLDLSDSNRKSESKG